MEGEVMGARIAVVGSGISGLSAAWLLHKSGAKVTLFEKEGYCGGHSLTDESPGFPVDLGFQVYNLTTYPNFVGLLEELGVDSEESEMSFALSLDEGAMEWASHGLSTILAQRENFWKLSFWQMIWDVIRFGREAPKVLNPKKERVYSDMKLGEYLKKHGYSQSFQYNYLLPMCAAVWSVPNAQVLEFPVAMLVQFWQNHHLLDFFQRPVWRVVKNRSRTYVNAILADLEDIWINAEVTSVVPSTPLSPLVVELASGHRQEFDAVILGTHSDTSLKFLGLNASKSAKEVLQAIPYGTNDIWVHTDEALMPRRRETWASWNFIGRKSLGDDAAVCVTYWLNRLQSLPPQAPDVFVTLNPVIQPSPGTVTRRLSLSHPIFSQAAAQAQQRLTEIQGQGGVYYAGAWCGYGFHEDGLKAGIAVAELLGARVPWRARSVSPKISLMDRLGIAIFDRFAKKALKQGCLRLILPNGQELCYGNPNTCKPPTGEGWRGLPCRRATVRIFDCSFFWKIITRHDTGLGESYMDNDFEVTRDLGCFLAVITANATNIEKQRGALGFLNWVGDKMLLFAHLTRSNTISGSRKNIEQHYDVGNDMYRLFLDPSMTYSSGIHKPGETLEQAQMRKLDALIDLAQLSPDDNVLEIGCGWGSLALRAVQRTGCRWTGITLSKAQLKEAHQRVKVAGLDDRITLLFCDYRDLAGAGTFDKVVSCEMIEAVGQENIPTFFRTIHSSLKVGGTAVIQAISEPDDRYEAYCASSDFIREHIFPGGHLPSLGAMVDSARWCGLSMTSVTDIGPDYAITLRQWRAAWEKHQQQVHDLGYSETMWRKYRFYFAYCEAAFDAKYIHNYQITWLKASQAANGVANESNAAASRGNGDSPDKLQHAPTPEPADPFTQVLLAVYFFLAGIAVSQRRLLWVIPFTSAVYLALLTSIAGVVAYLAKLNTSLRRLGSEGQAWLSVDIVHLLHSALTFLAACEHVVRQPTAWLVNHKTQMHNAHLLPDLLVCTSAGFFGFHLFILVHQRLFKRVYKVVLHFTVLLVLFGSAAYKAEHTPLLACSLLSELSTVFYLLAKIQDLHNVPVNNRLRKAILAAEIPATLLLRVMPHAFIGASALLNAASFSNKGYYLAAVTGSVYINVVNVRRVGALLKAVSSGKAHSE